MTMQRHSYHVERVPASAIRHYARRAGITEGSLRVALDRNMTAGDKVRAIQARYHARGGTITMKAAKQRLDAALPVARHLLSEIERGWQRRRNAAVDSPSLEERYARQIRMRLSGSVGGTYSGSTRWEYMHGAPAAWTNTSAGDTYSRRCTYHRTDAVHTIRATISGLRRVAASGLPYSLSRDRAMVLDVAVVRVEPGGRILAATIVDETGKALRCRPVFLADQGGGQYHVARTERAAVTALRRAAEANAPFSGSQISAPELQKTLGWCGAGIRSWCASHGIRRDLAARLQSGARPQAIVRLLKKHGGPKDEYDRRLLAHLAG